MSEKLTERERDTFTHWAHTQINQYKLKHTLKVY